MKVLKYTSTLKACGKEYGKIVFWNRFLRNKTELIITVLPAIASIFLMINGYTNSFLLILYAIFWFYPIFIFSQFKTIIKNHLKNRDQSESAPCEFTFMETGILAEIPDYDLKYVYNWEDCTTIYSKFGYYMMFQKGKMLVMLRQADIPEDIREDVAEFIKKNVNQNTCRILF